MRSRDRDGVESDSATGGRANPPAFCISRMCKRLRRGDGKRRRGQSAAILVVPWRHDLNCGRSKRNRLLRHRHYSFPASSRGFLQSPGCGFRATPCPALEPADYGHAQNLVRRGSRLDQAPERSRVLASSSDSAGESSVTDGPRWGSALREAEPAYFQLYRFFRHRPQF